LRMSPSLDGNWLHQASMTVYVGGAELNVATALATWNVPVKYCTALPNHYLSKEIIGYLGEKKIDHSAIYLSGNRIGVYYLPRGKDLKNAGVIYDRAHSSFSELTPGMIDWNKALEDVSWLHFSAISPALNENMVDLCKEALEKASEKKITISVDLNYRSKLWQYGKKPVQVMPELVKYCNVIMGNIWSAADLLGTPVDTNIHDKGSKTAYLEHARESALHIMKRFPVCNTVANTFRFDDDKGIRYYAALDTMSAQFVSKEFSTHLVVDKVGSGDCFMAGLIYGLYEKLGMQEIVNYAASSAFGKLMEHGDATNQDVETIKSRFMQYAQN
jgi:2-dehydro-3-deoxygluconokinase